jgi:hypothetical protein
MGRGARFTSTAIMKLDTDRDHDNRAASHYDSDEHSYVVFGHPANAGDRMAIENMLRSYYDAAAADNGTRACLLIDSLEAESIADRSSTRSGSTLKACAAVATETFAQHRRELVAKRERLSFLALRVEGEIGLALLGFGPGSEGYLLLHREGVWKTAELENSVFP